MALQEQESAIAKADEQDEDLQLALKLSAEASSGNVPAPWSCEICTFDNKADFLTCEMCGSPKPNLTQDAATSAEEPATDPGAEASNTTGEAGEGKVDETAVLVDRAAMQQAELEAADRAVAIVMQQELNDHERQSHSAAQARVDLAHSRDPMWLAKYGPSRLPQHLDHTQTQAEEEEEEGEGDGDPSEAVELMRGLGRRGAPGMIRLANGTIVTKHDAKLNGRHNAKMAGDKLQGCEGLDEKTILPNTPFQALKRDLKRTSGTVKGISTRGAMAGEERQTREGVLDPHTRQLIFKMVNKGLLTDINGVAKQGKEAVVYHAVGFPSQHSKRRRHDQDDDTSQHSDLSSEWADFELDMEAPAQQVPGLDLPLPEVEPQDPTEGPAEEVPGAEISGEVLSNAPPQAPEHATGTIPDPPHTPHDLSDLVLPTEPGEAGRIQEGKGLTDPVAGYLFTADPHRKHPPEAEAQADIGGEEKTNISSSAEESQPVEIAVKVFFTTLNQFSNRAEYVDGDPRYRQRSFSRQTKRKMIHTWTEKEFRNLTRAHRCGIPCPTPILYQEHLLLMTFVGRNGWPAPQLHDLPKGSLKTATWHRVYLQTVAIIRDLYQRARLVHADLSEFNLLYTSDKRVVVIDFGQSVDRHHAKAKEFLAADVRNVLVFFKKRQVNTHSREVVLSFITEYDAMGGLRGAADLASAPGNEIAVDDALCAICDAEDSVSDAVRSVLLFHQNSSEGDGSLEEDKAELQDDGEPSAELPEPEIVN